MEKFNKLLTERGENLSFESWNNYPRPQLKRNSFYNLNGNWKFEVTDGEFPEKYSKNILVPYPPESILSGVDELFDESETLWYRRTFKCDEDLQNKRLLLHFGAVDQKCKVYVNDALVGENIGGYNNFSFDITEFVKEENELVVSVTDTLSDLVLPYGKQTAKRGGMWYTKISGIWQTVWMEAVPKQYIKKLKIDVTESLATIEFDGISDGKVYLSDDGQEFEIKNGVATITPNNVKLWSPENPYLYRFKAVSGEDVIESYFALRTLEIKEFDGISRLCLNGEPYFFHGLLDQGYWSDGIMTPPSYLSFEDDILAMKELGFNMLRKHIKVEIEQFYYDCDRLGMIVFQDMVNNSKYSFLKDTALPTVGLLRKNDKRLHKNEQTRKAFVDGMLLTVDQLYNHPCICEWTIFNEGWGQFCADEMYDKLKNIDSSRFVDSASGWFTARKTDFNSKHIYFRKLKNSKGNKPYFISEFGGYSYKPEGHVFNEKNTYGYGKFEKIEDFSKAFCSLYENQVIPLVKEGLCATVYTQVSDVEDETNGLLSYDRKIQKIKSEDFSDISKRLKESLTQENNKPKKRFFGKALAILLSLCIVLGVSGLSINAHVKNKTKELIVTPKECENFSADCIIVLGCGVKDDGTPSDMLKDRLKMGIELYNLGVAPKLLMSGDHGQVEYDEVNTMKDFAVSMGVPEEDIFLDHAGFSTYDSICRASEIFGAEKVVIVSQKYHLHRALYIADAFDIDARGVGADYHTYYGQTMRDFREVLARVKDYFNSILKPSPKYLGEEISLQANGNVTNG